MFRNMVDTFLKCSRLSKLSITQRTQSSQRDTKSNLCELRVLCVKKCQLLFCEI